MSATTQRTLDDRMGGVRRFIRALANDVSEWEPEHLAALLEIEQELFTVRQKVVYGMREHGVTDGQIGAVLGISQQAVSKRWPGGGKYQGAAGRYRAPATDTTRR